MVVAFLTGPAAAGKGSQPWTEVEIKLPTGEAEVVLGCTLTLPGGKGPFPGAVLLTVAGPNDRDQTVFAHKGFADLAHGLGAAGIASLRCDDRGVGRSTGTFLEASYDDLADTALACHKALAERPEVDSAQVGFIGNSEGGAIGPLAASREEAVAFVVLLAGPGVPGAVILQGQLDAAITTLGIGEEKAAALRKQLVLFLEIQKKDPSAESTRREMRAFLEAGGRSLFPPYAFIPRDLDQLTDYLLSPWHRSMVAHDPAAILRELQQPVLALAGDKDRVLDPDVHLVAIREALQNNPDATVELLPGLNHLFQTANTGSVLEYAMLPEAISPAAVSKVGGWIAAQSQATRRPERN